MDIPYWTWRSDEEVSRPPLTHTKYAEVVALILNDLSNEGGFDSPERFSHSLTDLRVRAISIVIRLKLFFSQFQLITFQCTITGCITVIARELD